MTTTPQNRSDIDNSVDIEDLIEAELDAIWDELGRVQDQTTTEKHLAGQHDQMTHGHGGRGRAAVEADLVTAKKAVYAKMKEAKQTGDYSGMSQLRKRVKELEVELESASDSSEKREPASAGEAHTSAPKVSEISDEPVALSPKATKAYREAVKAVNAIGISSILADLPSSDLEDIKAFAEQESSSLDDLSHRQRATAIAESAKGWIAFKTRHPETEVVAPSSSKRGVRKSDTPASAQQFEYSPAPEGVIPVPWDKIDVGTPPKLNRASLGNVRRQIRATGISEKDIPPEMLKQIAGADSDIRSTLESAFGYQSAFSGRLKQNSRPAIAYADWNGDLAYGVRYGKPSFSTMIHENLHLFSNTKAFDLTGKHMDIEEGTVEYLTQAFHGRMLRQSDKYDGSRPRAGAYQQQVSHLKRLAQHTRKGQAWDFAYTLLQVPAPQRPDWIRKHSALPPDDPAWQMIPGGYDGKGAQ